MYVGVSAAYAVCASGIVAFLAPAAAGSGMPEMKVSMMNSNLTLTHSLAYEDLPFPSVHFA